MVSLRIYEVHWLGVASTHPEDEVIHGTYILGSRNSSGNREGAFEILGVDSVTSGEPPICVSRTRAWDQRGITSHRKR